MNESTIRRISDRVKAGIPYRAHGGTGLKREVLRSPESTLRYLLRHPWGDPDGKDDAKNFLIFLRQVKETHRTDAPTRKEWAALGALLYVANALLRELVKNLPSWRAA